MTGSQRDWWNREQAYPVIQPQPQPGTDASKSPLDRLLDSQFPIDALMMGAFLMARSPAQPPEGE